MNLKLKIEALIDLTRAHFAPAWPILFLGGLMLGYSSSLSAGLLVRVGLIGMFGFMAGLVLNDLVDRNIDKKDVEFDRLTKYWRPFKERPLPSGHLSLAAAVAVFVVLAVVSLILIQTLGTPHNLYLTAFMVYGYSVEAFYQLKKRNQSFPWAQLIGRTDLALFPAAGYVCHAHPDKNILLLFLSFYPWAQAHLGLNDILDIPNDEARGMKTVPILYGKRATLFWISSFTALHMATSIPLIRTLEFPSRLGYFAGYGILFAANAVLWRYRNGKTPLLVLFLYHLSVVVYGISMILHGALG